MKLLPMVQAVAGASFINERWPLKANYVYDHVNGGSNHSSGVSGSSLLVRSISGWEDVAPGSDYSEEYLFADNLAETYKVGPSPETAMQTNYCQIMGRIVTAKSGFNVIKAKNKVNISVYDNNSANPTCTIYLYRKYYISDNPLNPDELLRVYNHASLENPTYDVNCTLIQPSILTTQTITIPIFQTIDFIFDIEDDIDFSNIPEVPDGEVRYIFSMLWARRVYSTRITAFQTFNADFEMENYQGHSWYWLNQNMTGPGQGALASAEADTNLAWKAFNGLTSGANIWRSIDARPQWLQRDIGYQTHLIRYALYGTTGYDLQDWTIQISPTGEFTGEETIIDTRVGQSVGSSYNYFYITAANRTIKGRYVRIVITATASPTNTDVREFQILVQDEGIN